MIGLEEYLMCFTVEDGAHSYVASYSFLTAFLGVWCDWYRLEPCFMLSTRHIYCGIIAIKYYVYAIKIKIS